MPAARRYQGSRTFGRCRRTPTTIAAAEPKWSRAQTNFRTSGSRKKAAARPTTAAATPP
jgi:hypothetical protein